MKKNPWMLRCVRSSTFALYSVDLDSNSKGCWRSRNFHSRHNQSTAGLLVYAGGTTTTVKENIGHHDRTQGISFAMSILAVLTSVNCTGVTRRDSNIDELLNSIETWVHKKQQLYFSCSVKISKICLHCFFCDLQLDSWKAYMKALKECAVISKPSGGICIDVHNIVLLGVIHVIYYT